MTTPIHTRQRIRTAAADALTASCPSVSGRVFPGRVLSFSESDLPALAVYTPEDLSEVAAYGKGAIEKRTLTLDVHVAVADADGGWDTADAIALEVESSLCSPRALGAAGAKQVILASSTATLDTSAEVPILTLVVRFTVIAFVTAGSPGIPR